MGGATCGRCERGHCFPSPPLSVHVCLFPRQLDTCAAGIDEFSLEVWLENREGKYDASRKPRHPQLLVEGLRLGG